MYSNGDKISPDKQVSFKSSVVRKTSKRMSYVHNISESLDNLLNLYPNTAKFTILKLQGNWSKIVGSKLSTLCYPSKIIQVRNKSYNLYICCNYASSIIELQHMEDEILNKLSLFFNNKTFSRIIYIKNLECNTNQIEEYSNNLSIPISRINNCNSSYKYSSNFDHPSSSTSCCPSSSILCESSQSDSLDSNILESIKDSCTPKLYHQISSFYHNMTTVNKDK